MKHFFHEKSSDAGKQERQAYINDLQTFLTVVQTGLLVYSDGYSPDDKKVFRHPAIEFVYAMNHAKVYYKAGHNTVQDAADFVRWVIFGTEYATCKELFGSRITQVY